MSNISGQSLSLQIGPDQVCTHLIKGLSQLSDFVFGGNGHGLIKIPRR